MIERSIYPKTQRIGNQRVIITEKLDGSNITFFVLEGELWIATRNRIAKASEFRANRDICYKGLIGWLDQYEEQLKECIAEGSVLCGEWIGMGKISYALPNRFYMFAKARLDFGLILHKIDYDPEHFQWAFKEQTIPEFIGIVPTVYDGTNLGMLSIDALDVLYSTYCSKEQRSVEGFVINFNGSIHKYVRHKNGKETPHMLKGD